MKLCINFQCEDLLGRRYEWLLLVANKPITVITATVNFKHLCGKWTAYIICNKKTTAMATCILNRNPPKSNQTGFVQHPVQRQTDIQMESYIERVLLFLKERKKCAVSTFILEIVLPTDKIQIYVGGISVQSSPSAADCVNHQPHFQATIARYGCAERP